ncbi:MAG: malonyl-ACP O-methyltransferase BioC [Pseudomonadota bacterium]
MKAIPDISIQEIARSFSKAAASYDDCAILQNTVGDRLLERLDYVKIQPKIILDLGCGTGHYISPLKKRYPKAQVIGVDVAHGMLKTAMRKNTRLLSKPLLMGGNAYALPLADESCELIFSNLAFQWCYDLPRLFSEMNRVLKPGGLLMFTSFGPDTLFELRQAWQAIDSYQHVNNFVDMHDVGDALLQSQFLDPVMDCERITMQYKQLRALMQDLKGLGAHNLNQQRRKSLTTPASLKRLEESYEVFRRNEDLPATYEVVYGHAWATEIKQIQLAPGSVAIPIDKIGGLKKKSR